MRPAQPVHPSDRRGGNLTRCDRGSVSANVFSTVLELPTSALGANPDIRVWGRRSVRRDGKLLHVDRAGHPSVSSFFNTD
jgi:hypothetical protein